MGYVVAILVCVIVLLVLLILDLLQEIGVQRGIAKDWERIYTEYRELVESHFNKY